MATSSARCWPSRLGGSWKRRADRRGERRTVAPAEGPAQRLRRSGPGYPRRSDRAGDPGVAEGALSSQLPGAAPYGREGARGGNSGSRRPWRLHAYRGRSGEDDGRLRQVEEPGQPPPRRDRRACERRPRSAARGAWPCLWLDATHAQVREGGRIVIRAAIIAVAVNENGKRKGLGVATGPSEAETFWTDFLWTLADRGLRGVKLVVADDHKGLRAAARRLFDATHQHGRLHGMRDALAHAPAKQRTGAKIHILGNARARHRQSRHQAARRIHVIRLGPHRRSALLLHSVGHDRPWWRASGRNARGSHGRSDRGGDLEDGPANALGWAGQVQDLGMAGNGAREAAAPQGMEGAPARSRPCRRALGRGREA